jgi:hypothetical protein
MDGADGSHLDADQRRRYRNFAVTMAAVFIGIGLAAVAYFVLHLAWLAVVLIVVSVPLRWVAMLLANANPPVRRRRRR